ncbi:MAG: hypothetical protein J6J39_01145 [Clostridia bacterium]|nr:hypothetical protein [Clostridia bacterium]
MGEGKAYQVNGRLYDSADAENLETPREFFKYNEVKVVTAADVAVAEVDGIKYTSLSAAIAAADLDTTITLLKDTDEDITVSKAVNIDFGGKKASGVFTFDGGSITVIGAFESGTKLKVKKNSYTTKVEWGTVVIWDQSDFLTNDDIQPVDAGAEIKSYGKSHALVHPHGWDHKVSDTQDGKLIEIYCKYLETCPYADYSDALGAWLELCSDELTYNGWTREARLSRYINAYLYTDSLPDSSDIVYYDENGKDLDGKPKNAGNYTASLTFVNADGTDVVATVDFIILPKKLTEDMITVEPSTEEYDGNAVTPVVTVKDGNTALIEGTDYVVSGDVSGTDVSTYTILVTGKGNYCDTVNISWNIAKADMDFISADNVEVTYDGNAYSVEVKGAPEDAEILYSTDGGNTYVAEKPTFTNVADSGTVYYKVTHKNYNEYSGAATITIQPKTITVTAEEKETIVNTALPTYTYRVEGLIGDDKLVTEPTFTTAADIAVIGEYDITASGADAGNNYSIKYVSAKLTVLTDNTVDVAKGYGKELKDYDPNIVTSDDKAELDKILDKINTLLVDETITDNGKKALEEVKAQVQGLIQKITDAEAATATENTEKVKDLTSDNVKPENKADLEKAAEDLEKALEEHGSNMTEDEKKVVEDEIKRIDDALTVIGNVEDVEELIEKIPDIIKKEDADVIKAADDAYSTLSDYEKSLVDDDVKKTLDDAKTALAELNKPAGTTSPNTGDNSNIFLWIALLFISGGAVITLTVVDRKKRIVKK